MSRILIAGCGYVGAKLGQELAIAGDEVFGLRRHTTALPEGVALVIADLGDPSTLAALPGEIDQVVYAASADESSEASYRRAYVDGLQNLLAVLGEKPRRLLFASSTGVYPQADGEWVDEDSTADPSHFTGKILREGERLALAAGILASVVRFGGIYGPGRTRLIDSVRAGTAVCSEEPPLWTNRIHRDDCAGVLRHLLALPELASIYVGVDDEPATQGEVYRWIAGRLGVAGPRIENDPARAATRRGSNKRCRNARLRASGYVFRYPTFREGYGALIDATG